MISYDSQLLDFYTENGVTVVLWNYRGYGESPGKSSMSVSLEFNLKIIVEDGLEVLKYVRAKMVPSLLVLHGRSLGGYVAKSLYK